MSTLAIAVALALSGCALDSDPMASELDHPSDEPWSPAEDEAFDTEWEDPDAEELDVSFPELAASVPEIAAPSAGSVVEDEERVVDDERDEPLAPESDDDLAVADEIGDEHFGAIARDRWDGVTGTGIRGLGPGFFRVASFPALEGGGRSRRRWIIDPDGNPYWGVGINTVLRTAGITLDEGAGNTMRAYLARFQMPRPTDWLDWAAQREWDRMGRGDDGELGFYFNNVGGFGHINDVPDYVPPFAVSRSVNPMNRYAPYGVVLTTHVCEEAPADRPPPACANRHFALASASGRPIGQRRVRSQRGQLGGENLATMGDPYNPAFRALLQARWRPTVEEVVEVRADGTPVTRRDDPKLMYWWLGNEDGLFDHIVGAPRGVVDLRQYLWAPCPATEADGTPRPPAADRWRSPRCAPEALEAFLREKYSHRLDALNRAWDRGFGAWTSIAAPRNRPTPGIRTGSRRCNAECGEDLQRFVRKLIRQWVIVTTTTLRELDPNHLISSPRLAVGQEDDYCFYGLGAECREVFTRGATVDGRVLRSSRRVPTSDLFSPWPLLRRNGQAGFDLISINAYSHNGRAGYVQPWFRLGIRKMAAESGLPVLVSEFGIRTDYENRTVRGLRWTNRAGAASFVREDGTEPIAELQRRRGVYYRHDILQFMSHRDIVGATLHRWADYYEIDGRRRQMNMGVVDPRGEAYTEMFGIGDRVRGVRATNEGLYTLLRKQTGGAF